MKYIKLIHETVCSICDSRPIEPMELCRQVVNKLELPPAAANPLVAKGFVSSLAIGPDSL